MISTDQPSASRRALTAFLLITLLGVAGVEALVSVRVYLRPMAERPFPQGYVSRGVWSCYGLIRPLDSTSTDIAPSFAAAQRVLHGDPQLYADFKPGGSSFIYPPTTAIELLPFGWLVDRFGMGRAVQAMDLLGRGATVVLVLIVLRFFTGTGLSRSGVALAIVAILAYFPLRWALFCVQAQTIINACLAGAILAYASSRQTLSGVLVGIAACMKPHFALLVLFAALRRRWRLAGAATVTGLLLIAASVVAIGVKPWHMYVTQIMPVVSDGYADYSNQSFNGLARRWVGDAYTFSLAPAARGVAVFSWCAALVMIALALAPRGGKHRGSQVKTGDGEPLALHDALDFSVALLALTIASPIAWNHHYGWAVALFALALRAAVCAGRSLAFYALLGVAYVLTATSWSPFGAGAAGWRTVADSKQLWGNILLLVLVWPLCTRLAVRASAGAPRTRAVSA